MKQIVFFLAALISMQVQGQLVFEEDFEDDSVGLDLATEGYQLSLGSSYTGTLTAIVTQGDTNRFARMVAKPNGAAQMLIVKTVDVEPGVIYRYEVDSRGPFKRWLRVYSEHDEMLFSSPDYKPTTDEEGQVWKNLDLTFATPPDADKIKIGFYHYWSGTIDLDNFIVTKIGEPGAQTAYFVSSSSGNDENQGTKESPWKSLEKISAAFLFPGDSVLFKRGDTLNGHFVVNGSGSAEEPILISSYGEGDLPVITGEVDSAGGGDYQEAILVENNDNLVFDGLEVQNERLASRNGVADTDAYGLYIKNTGDRVMRNLVFRNMVFKNVFAVQPILDPDDFNSIQVAGLCFTSGKNTEAGKEKHIRDILVEDCYFGNLQRFGIRFNHSGGNAGVGNDSINRNMNILIRNNEFSYNGGTAVLPSRTYNCLIENNIFDHPGASTDPRMPGRGSSIWSYKAINTIMQYNMCISTRGYLDSYGIHIDHNCLNTFVQYNYMEDCEGGFVEILHSNRNAVYRFNVSVNDGWRVNPTWTNSNFTIWVTSDRWSDDGLKYVDGAYIYNNTVLINRPFTTVFSLDGKNMFVYNNIFSSTNGSGMGHQNTVVRDNDTPFFMSNNLFEGTVDNRWVAMDAKPQIGSPLFDSTGADNDKYSLILGSPALDNGAAVTGPPVIGAGYGVFKDIPVYPDVDFYGNPVDLESGIPNIGACNVKYPYEEDLTVISDTVFMGDTIVVTDTSISCKTYSKSTDPEFMETRCDTSVAIKSIHIEDTTSTSVNYVLKPKNNWLIYPDPAGSRIKMISKSNLSGEVDITLVDLRGRTVQADQRTLHPGQKEFDLILESSPDNGIYILNIRTQGTSHSRRIILYQ